MEKNNPSKEHSAPTLNKVIRNSSDPDIAGSYYAMQRAGQAAIVTTVDGKIFQIPATKLIKQHQLAA